MFSFQGNTADLISWISECIKDKILYINTVSTSSIIGKLYNHTDYSDFVDYRLNLINANIKRVYIIEDISVINSLNISDDSLIFVKTDNDNNGYPCSEITLFDDVYKVPDSLTIFIQEVC